MFSSLKKLFVSPPPTAASDAYIALVAAARNPFFFESLGVPDTLDGRFELIVLHLFFLQHRLVNESAEAQEFSAQLGEVFFMDMDRSLREMGIADTGVKHRIKAMAKAYHGRLQVYAAALNDDEALYAALARNLYGTVAQGDVAMLEKMAAYVKSAVKHFAAIPAAPLCENNYGWPAP